MSMTRRNKMQSKLGKKIESLQKQIADRDASMQRPVLQKQLKETQGQLAFTKDALANVQRDLAMATALLEDRGKEIEFKDRTILELQKQVEAAV